MKTFLALTGVASLISSVHSAASCSECGGNTCMLDGTATSIRGGVASVSVNFCNYDSSKSNVYALSFGVSPLPSCDTSNALLPVVASLVAADGCTAEACAVTVNFKSALDWAIALQNNGVSNKLTAQLTSGGNADVVTIATFETMAAAVMNSGTASVSVCATELEVSGSRFSSVDSCNTAQICRGASTDTTCTTELMSNAQARNISCDGEACTGKLTWSQPLPCDGSTGDATALIVGVTVASSTRSNFVSVGSMTAPTFNISDASGLKSGSSELVLTTDTFCSPSGVSLNVSLADKSETVEVSSVNSTMNGTVVVELASPLSGDDIQLSLSQCGVSVTGSFFVGKSSGDSSSEGAEEDETEAGTTGSRSTQEADSSTGLSKGYVVAIVIAAVATAGFIFEYVYHKIRHPKPLVQEPPVATTA